MKKRILFFIVLLLFPIFKLTAEETIPGKIALKQFSSAFNKVAEKAIPAVVHISTEKTIRLQGYPYYHFFRFLEEDDIFRELFQSSARELKRQGLGSGVIVSGDGYILTNYHVVRGWDKITITLTDKRKFSAKVIGHDQKKDLSLLKIDADNLSAIKFGNSDNINIGDWAIAVGSPFGLAGSFTVGVISAKGRGGEDGDRSGLIDLIQTDAAINPGNSGGALLNIEGEIVGINTAIVTKTGGYLGIGFAVPINVAKQVMKNLLTSNKKPKGWLGVYIQDINPELSIRLGLPNIKGVLVTDVIDKSPAKNAGLKRGDIILSFGDSKLRSASELKEVVKATELDKNIKLEIIRNKRRRNLSLVLQTKEKSEQPEIGKKADKLGFVVENISEREKTIYRLSDKEGIVISYIQPNSPAERRGLRAGDIILEINNFPVRSVKSYKHLLAKAGNDKEVLLLVKTMEYTQYVVLRL
ncbi:Do family serine endopeptidase [Candidatus Margulisiibacteriota bacterium]